MPSSLLLLEITPSCLWIILHAKWIFACNSSRWTCLPAIAELVTVCRVWLLRLCRDQKDRDAKAWRWHGHGHTFSMISGPLINQVLITQISADSSELRVFPPHSETSSSGRYSLPRHTLILSLIFSRHKGEVVCRIFSSSESHTLANFLKCLYIYIYIYTYDIYKVEYIYKIIKIVNY